METTARAPGGEREGPQGSRNHRRPGAGAPSAARPRLRGAVLTTPGGGPQRAAPAAEGTAGGGAAGSLGWTHGTARSHLPCWEAARRPSPSPGEQRDLPQTPLRPQPGRLCPLTCHSGHAELRAVLTHPPSSRLAALLTPVPTGSPGALTPPAVDAGLTLGWSKSIFQGLGDQSSWAPEARPGPQWVLAGKSPVGSPQRQGFWPHGPGVSSTESQVHPYANCPYPVLKEQGRMLRKDADHGRLVRAHGRDLRP